MQEEEILSALNEAKKKNSSYSRGRILSSMCTSAIEIAKKAYYEFIETNSGDYELFKGIKELEKEAINELKELFNLGNRGIGLIVSGGTEANIIALWAFRNSKKRKKRKVIIPETAHFSILKACDILDLKPEIIEVDENNEIKIKHAEKSIDDNTLAIIAVAGSTEYGSIDDIEALSRIAMKRRVFLHVDAAFGGFVIPFLKDLGFKTKKFDFSLKGVSSLTADPHKMGLTPIPCGCIFFRDRGILKNIEYSAPYLKTEKQVALLGTRPGASAAAAFAAIKYFGKQGYREIVKECMQAALKLYNELSNLGFATKKPEMNIVVFKCSEEVLKELENRGWKISRTRKKEARIVVMPHVTKLIDRFIEELKEIKK